MAVSFLTRARRAVLASLFLSLPAEAASECDSWRDRHPEWVFCDDFESAGALNATGRYFEVNDNAGEFKPAAGVGLHGSVGMQTVWQAGEVDGGNLKLGFGRSPSSYFSKGIRTGEDFREIYYRMYVRLQEGWKGNPYKLSRATVMAKSDWSQAMIAHLWGDQGTGLQLDPVSCTDASGAVKCSGYNDFDNMKWIGAKPGGTRLFDGTYGGKWVCVETHVKLNTAGKADGVHEFWIGDSLEANRQGLDFLGTYNAYGINSILFENYWNSGAPQAQKRWFDNIVVSTKRVGCAESLPAASGLRALPGGRFAILPRERSWSADGRAVSADPSVYLPVFLKGGRPEAH
jgi:hypothetical protein